MTQRKKELEDLATNILRVEAHRKPFVQTQAPKTTITPFGLVHSKLLTLQHNKPLRHGEILAQWIKDKQTGKKEKFIWMGVVENSLYDPVRLCWNVHYRPFVDQEEKGKERFEQLYIYQKR